MTEWHRLEAQEAVTQINSDIQNGLTTAEAARRLEEYGLNELVEQGKISPWVILLEQFKGIMVVILMISAVISLLLGETIDALVIMIIVVLNALLGFTQEYRAEQAMAALKRMAVPHVRVRRDGHLQEITARELVPGASGVPELREASALERGVAGRGDGDAGSRPRQRHHRLQHHVASADHAHGRAQRLRVGGWRLRHGGQSQRVDGGLGAAVERGVRGNVGGGGQPDRRLAMLRGSGDAG